MKRFVCVVLSLILTFSFGAAAFANAPGDLNNDGSVTAEDARTALRIAVGLEDAAPGSAVYLAADVSGDGAVTAEDARLILRAAVGLETFAPAQPEKPDDPAPEKELSRSEVYALAHAYTVEITSETPQGTVLGSGFFVSADGRLLTNYHVVQDTSKLTVKDCNGAEHTDVTVLGFDRDADIALLQIGGEGYDYARLNRTGYRTGDKVYALGSSLGLTDTFSEGMISNAARTLEGYSEVVYIQHTVPISQGNSGGPLIDEYGRAIGLNTLGADEGQNLNFAVPVRYMDELDLSHSMTTEEFAALEAEYKEIRLEGGYGDTVHLRPGAVAVFPFSARSRNSDTIVVKCENEAISVGISTANYGLLHIVAVSACENVPVTLYMKNTPEITCTVTVTVSENGSKNSGGALEDIPDFGAMIGKAPALLDTGSALPTYVYSAGTFGSLGDADQVRADYEAALKTAGFTLAQQQSSILGSTYVYTCARLGLTLAYMETRGINGRLRGVQIQFGASTA